MSNRTDPNPSPAELFERFFGPSLFVPWTEVLLDHARPRPGERVLDVACATGIVARHTAPRVGADGAVVGVDINPEMLAVARERSASEDIPVDWREADAMELPFADESFDLALCQQGLQFFADAGVAMKEARRVLAEGGRIALNVWQPLERHPVYSALLETEARELGAELEEVGRPFLFGNDERVEAVLEEAGFEDIEVLERTLEVEFDEPETFVALTVRAGAAVVPELAPEDPAERTELVEVIARETEEVLRAHRVGDRLRFPMPNYIALAQA